MEAYDHRALDASAKEIVDHAKRTNAKVAGPVPLPTRMQLADVVASHRIVVCLGCRNECAAEMITDTAMVTVAGLPAWLSVIPIVLLPLLNDLRAVRGSSLTIRISRGR